MKWIAIAGMFLGAGTLSWGKNLIVGAPNTPCPNAGYTTISSAIAAAHAGDVIEICPALYAEQLTIAMPLTLKGLQENGVGRVLIQPTTLTTNSEGFVAVISVIGTSNVTISNLAIDASNNTVTACTPALAGIHFYNASGTVDSDAISGTELSTQTDCTALFPGSGFGVQADQATGATGPFHVTVQNSSMHDFGRDAVLVNGAAEVANVNNNFITGVGPSSGVNQFGVFLANGATGEVVGNNITQGNCGSISTNNCIPLRSEGVVLRAAGNGVLIANNIINNVQAGIFVNGATYPQVIGNTITSVDALNGIHMQGSVSGFYAANRLTHVGPISIVSSDNGTGCAINDIPGTGSSGNNLLGNWVNDAYCGIGYVSTDLLEANTFLNVLALTLNNDVLTVYPPPTEPGQ
ncbi:MAG TPA: right-handed parallel beta-helix repeat-containing protein [Bryobacteraceae bacterium]|nr:right-handed parallel beta-helix repeat-containing protein [Bryobacteraceae bacterium]